MSANRSKGSPPWRIPSRVCLSDLDKIISAMSSAHALPLHTVAAVCTRHGHDDGVITVQETPVAAPGPGEALVEVELAGLGHSDALVVADRYQVKASVPFVPGSEFAGVVTAVGAGTVGVAVGDRVLGTMFVGACARHVVADARVLQPIPDGVDAATAIAGGVAYATAYHALRSVAGLRAGETVLVLGAAGGVGLAAVDIARAMGATVVGVAGGPEKAAAVTSAGAVAVIDSAVDDLRGACKEAVPAGADVVLDPVGGRWSEPALRALRPGGRFVTVGFASGEIPSIPLNLVLLKAISIVGFEFRTFAQHRLEEFVRDRRELASMLSDGTLRPRVASVHPLRELPAALREIADRRAIGKVLIDVRN